ncbi:hypothetical protein BG004_004693 [Podila humilis]|nr:hypothetical protein BG004_004693 [Podila humilis]
MPKEKQDAEEKKMEENNLRFYKDKNELVEWYDLREMQPVYLLHPRFLAEAEIGYRRTVLKCMTAGCDSFFPDSEAKRFLEPAVFKCLELARQQADIKAASLDSLVECPFCAYAVIIEDDNNTEFRCMGSKCKRISCRLCKEPTHLPCRVKSTARSEKEQCSFHAAPGGGVHDGSSSPSLSQLQLSTLQDRRYKMVVDVPK